MNDASDNFYNNVTASSIKIYVYTQTDLSAEGAFLDFWSNQMGYNVPYDCGSMNYYSDCNGTPLNVPRFPGSPLPAGIYFMYEGWFIQLFAQETSPGVFNPKLIPTDGSFRTTACPNDCQPARQVIPLFSATTEANLCNGIGSCVYMVNNSITGNGACRKTSNFDDFQSGTTRFLISAEIRNFPPYFFYNRGNNPTLNEFATGIVPIGARFYQIGCVGKSLFPPTAGPGGYALGTYFGTTAASVINTGPLSVSYTHLTLPTKRIV